MRSNSQHKNKPVPSSNKPTKQSEYKPYNLRSKEEEAPKYKFAYNTPPRKYEEKIENPLKYVNYVEPMQMKKFERKPPVTRSERKEVIKSPKKEQAPYKSDLPFEIVLPTFGKKQTVSITMEIKDKNTKEIVHKVIFKTEEQLELFHLLEKERVFNNNSKQFSIQVPNQFVDEKSLDILIKILTLCEYNVPEMPKVSDGNFRDMLSDVRIYDILASLNNTDAKKLFDATCYLDMKSMKTLICTKMACTVMVLKNERMLKGEWKNMMNLKPFKQQAKELGVKEEFTYANFQELKEDNDNAKIICD